MIFYNILLSKIHRQNALMLSTYLRKLQNLGLWQNKNYFGKINNSSNKLFPYNLPKPERNASMETKGQIILGEKYFSFYCLIFNYFLFKLFRQETYIGFLVK